MERRGNAKYSTRKRIDELGSLASEGKVVHSRTFSASPSTNYPWVVTTPWS